MSYVTSKDDNDNALYVGNPVTGQTGVIAHDGYASNFGVIGPAGRQLIWSSEHNRRITTFYDPTTQKRVGAIKNWPVVDRYVASPDGSRLYALQHMLSDPGPCFELVPAPFVLRVYDATSFALIETHEIAISAHSVGSQTVLADGRLRALTHLYDDNAKLQNKERALFTSVLTVDPATGAATHEPLPGTATFVEFSPSGKYLLRPHHASIELWNVEPMELVRVIPHVLLNPGHLIAWQPDAAAFWIKIDSTVACVGLDGSVSPRIDLGNWYPNSIETTGDRTARLICLTDKLVTIDVDGSPGTDTRVVGKKGAHIKAHGVGPKDDGVKSLAKRLASEHNTLVIPLADKSEAAHIAAIEKLAEIFEADEIEGRFTSKLSFAFELKGKRIPDKKFFGDVAKSMPAAAPAMKRMVEAVYASSDVEKWEDEDTVVAALKAFVVLVPDGVDVLVQPSRRVSAGGRFYKVILPLMIETCGWRPAMIEFILTRVLPCSRAAFFSSYWVTSKLGPAVAEAFTPQQFAERFISATLTDPVWSVVEIRPEWKSRAARWRDRTPWEDEMVASVTALLDECWRLRSDKTVEAAAVHRMMRNFTSGRGELPKEAAQHPGVAEVFGLIKQAREEA